MTTEPKLPDLTKYLALIDGFIAGEMSAPAFEGAYLTAVKTETRMFGDPIFPILQRLFSDADDYVENPELRTEPEDLDDDQLRACACRARKSLRELGFE